MIEPQLPDGGALSHAIDVAYLMFMFALLKHKRGAL